MDEFVSLGDVSDLEDGQMKQLDAGGHEFLIAKVDGDFYVSDARCPHMHGHLARGRLDGAVITCPVHHSKFNLIDGSVIRWTDFTGAIKTVGDLARHPRPLRIYEFRLEGSQLSVGPQKPPPAPSA